MKKVLIITYYWPPAGGAGIQRVLKFVKYLPQAGWEPVVLTVRNGEYPALDPGLEREVPEGVRVYKSGSFQPFGLYRRLTGRRKEVRITNDVFTRRNRGAMDRLAKWARLNLFIPDARVGWYGPGVRLARRIMEKERPDLIFSSSPPHSLQLIARKIAREYGVKWVADFRDPWSELVHYLAHPRSWLTRRIDGRLERSVLRRADAVTTVGNDVAACLRRHADRPVEVIYNGYDADDIPARVPERLGDEFVITYTGELSKDRVPPSFLDAVQVLLPEYPQLRLRFVGNVCDGLREAVAERGLDAIVRYEAYKPHRESLRALAEADALLLVVNRVPGNRGILTGKLFEYMGMKRPILCIGPEDGDAAALLEKAGAGYTADYEDREKAVRILERYIRGEHGLTFDVSAYERQGEARQLAALFNRLTAGN